MKLFLDTANLDEIRQALEWGILDGVTTNPSLIAREGRPMHEQIRAICEIVDGDVSAEVVATDTEGMLREAEELAQIHPNVVVKIPLTREGIRAVSQLSKKGIRTNVTLCFSPMQALLAAKAGAYIISPFIGRIDDTSWPGIELIRKIVTIYRNYGFKTQVLAASLRHPPHVVEVALAGADIATVPFKVLNSLFNHPLTDIGLKRFLEDYRRVFQETSVHS